MEHFNKFTKLYFQSILTKKINFGCSHNATNQPKSTVELGYMCARGLSSPQAVKQWHSPSSWNIKRNFYSDLFTILNRSLLNLSECSTNWPWPGCFAYFKNLLPYFLKKNIHVQCIGISFCSAFLVAKPFCRYTFFYLMPLTTNLILKTY